VELQNGRVWSWQGDGGLCAFLDDDEKKVDHAVQCGIDIVQGLSQFNRKSKLEGDIRVRVAVDLGQATWRENTGLFHSNAINFVSHLESRTTPDSIAISGVVRQNCSNELQRLFRSDGDLEGIPVYVCDKHGLGLLRELKRVRDGISILIEKLKRSHFKPDLIVGVGRSGGIIAAMLAGNMGITTFVVLSRSVETKDGKRVVQSDNIAKLNKKRIIRESKKVLLVFVEIRSAATYQGFVNLLRSARIKNFRTATLFISSRAKRNYSDVFYAYEGEFDLSKAPWVINEKAWERL
jgi:hypoxanthine phosphoribosyltransferase